MKRLHFGSAYCTIEYYEDKVIHQVAMRNLVSKRYELSAWDIK
jgi:hypothetical protein